MTSETVTLRPVAVSDEGLLLRVYGFTRAAELALTDWDEATRDRFVQMQFNAQTTHYRHHWPASEHSVIEVTSQGQTVEVGRLWVDRRTEEIHVLDIAILPGWCSRGIGGICLARLMSEASQANLKLTIHVEQGNPARRLYDRLGFQPVGPQQGLHQYMVWRQTAGALSPTKENIYEEA